MFRINFLTALRKFGKNPFTSSIKILGLAIGISAALVIYLIVSYDLGFDKFEKDKERIYRVVSDFKFSGESYYNPGVTAPLAAAIKNEVTGVSSVIPFHQPNFDMAVTIPGGEVNQPIKISRQTDIIFADSNYFNLLSYRWLAGSQLSATDKPFQVVLTEERAKNYFPALAPANILGKEIIYNDTIRVTVSGVVDDIREQTDFTFKEIISLPTIANSNLRNSYALHDWNGTDATSQLFIKLNKDIRTGNVEKQLLGLIGKYLVNQKQDDQNHYIFRLQPLSDLHFNKDYGIFLQWNSSDKTGTVNKSVLYGLMLVAVFLLLLGSVNFINLATAHATQRAKEVGIRKTLGSSQQQLRTQFFAETFIVTIVSAILSVALIPILLRIFRDFIPEGLGFGVSKIPGILIFLGGLIVVVTLLSGFYPSMILSRYKPVSVLKSQPVNLSGESMKVWVRKTLSVSQLVIAQVFIMGTLIVTNQILFTMNKDLGFRKDAVITFNTSYNDRDENKKQVLVDQLQRIPGIAMTSMSNLPPATVNKRSSKFIYRDGTNEIKTDAQIKFADGNYVPLYRIKLLAGENIQTTDTINGVLINQSFLHALGLSDPQAVLGKKLEWNKKSLGIIGVVADFHEKSLHEHIKPLLIASNSKQELCVNVLLQPSPENSGTWKKTIDAIQKLYTSIYPDFEFEYSFLDDSIANFYKGDQHIAEVLKWATGIAILISCLGLLGLIVHTTNARTKEMGVRKVLGATVLQIISTLVSGYLFLVLIAFLIAVPLTWLWAQQWLENFSYKTGIAWWIFPAAGILMMVVTIFTLSFQTIRTALANPIKALRSE